jgi:hypothetical protein
VTFLELLSQENELLALNHNQECDRFVGNAVTNKRTVHIYGLRFDQAIQSDVKYSD